MELSIIFVNWNAVEYLRESIASIYEKTTDITFEIIVVDNTSPEGGVEKLKELFPEIQLIKSAKNLGFAGANNLGFHQSHGEFVLFLNPDTKLLGPTVNVLVQGIRGLPDAGVVGCKMFNADMSVQITSIQKLPTITNQLVSIEALQTLWPHCPIWNIGPLFSAEATPVKAEVIPGACMLLRRTVFEQVGMFSEDYFMYAEDLDLNYKLKRAGYTNYYFGNAAIIHYGGGSSSKQSVSQWATIMKQRAMTRYFQKTRGPFYERLYRIAMGCSAALRLSVLGLLYPFSKLSRNQQSLLVAREKWKIVLKWSFGRTDLALQDR